MSLFDLTQFVFGPPFSRMKILVLWSFLVSLAIGAAENDYETNIDHGVLKSIKKLRKTDELDLSKLGIEKIKDGVFKNVSVKILNLESNNISNLESGAFSDLGENIEKLNLGSNPIRKIDSSFVGLKNLKLLNFSDNPLKRYFTAGELAGVPHTAKILLKGNELQIMNSRTFEKISEDSSHDELVWAKARRGVNWPKNLEYELTPLGEEFQLYLVADRTLIKDMEEVPGLHGDSQIICMEDAILKRISSLEKNESLPKNCSDIRIDHNLRYLELDNRGIRDVDKGWYQLQNVPIIIINFSANNLTEVSPELLNDLPERIKVIDLSENSIKRIKKGAFSNVHLKAVSLRANLIEYVEDESFESSNLEELYLTGNKISDISFIASLPSSLNLLHLNRNQILHIPTGIFSELRNLTQLALMENGITEIERNAFTGLTSLEIMNLADNKISKIKAGAFFGLENLEKMSLNNNSISYLVNDTFDGLDNLTDLHMSLNNFTSITKKNFCRLPDTLLFLDLGENKITDIESGCFVGVPHDILYLRNNKLTKILPTYFQIDDLFLIDLENNLITEVSQDSFQGLPTVRDLSLAGNLLSEIPPGTGKSFSSVVSLDISRNPFTKLENGALYGVPKTRYGEVLVKENQLEFIQGGIFENV